LFKSFWQAGFESACHINRFGTRLDMIASTQHDVLADADYAGLREVGLRTARDGVRWHLIERRGQYDFASLARLAEAAARHNVQVIWNLFHYGWPDDLELMSPAFIGRFARFCHATARWLKRHTSGAPFFVPLNEISFFAWAVGEVAYIGPLCRQRGAEIKRQLVRAAIAGMEAIWSVDRAARFIHAEPLIHVVAPRDRPHLARAAAAQTASQFEVWDMLAGNVAPELGGHPRYLDIVGVNYYHANQWEYPGGGPEARLRREDEPRDDRWVPLHQLLKNVYARYHRPLLVTETSHFGEGRVRWLNEIALETARARQLGVPLEGVCLYPIVDRHDWEDDDHWHHSGLWEIEHNGAGCLQRVLNQAYAAELRRLVDAEPTGERLLETV
jgi:beta-glucosidase/6-phospho-beta-glucosidase/beta-galactosidase